MVKFILIKSPDEWATTKQACRDELVVYLFFSPIYIYIFVFFFSFLSFFPYNLHFSGIQKNKSEFIDISYLRDTKEREELRYFFLRVGFADESAGTYKLRPCPLGTSVDTLRGTPTCKNCSAGKFKRLRLHNSFQ